MKEFILYARKFRDKKGNLFWYYVKFYNKKAGVNVWLEKDSPIKFVHKNQFLLENTKFVVLDGENISYYFEIL